MSRPASPLSLDEQLCFSLYQASIAVGRVYKPLLDEVGITYPQYLVLSTLWESDGRTVGAVADRLALEPSTVTPLLKRLATAGLIERERNPENERQVIVRLTGQGRALQARTICLAEALLRASGLTIEGVRRLNGEVRAVRDALAAHVGAQPQRFEPTAGRAPSRTSRAARARRGRASQP